MRAGELADCAAALDAAAADRARCAVRLAGAARSRTPAVPAPASAAVTAVGSAREFSVETSAVATAPSAGRTPGEKLEVRYDGDIEFTDDDTDVKSAVARRLPADQGRQLGWCAGRSSSRADAARHASRAGSGSDRPRSRSSPKAVSWLAQALPRFIRQTGARRTGAGRAYPEGQGPTGVLAEISLIEGSWAKRVYFSELLNSGSLDAPDARAQVVTQAGREIDSDFELASLLIGSADRFSARRRHAAGVLRRGPQHRLRLRDASRPVGGAQARSRSAPRSCAESPRREHGDRLRLRGSVAARPGRARLQPLDGTARAAFFKALGHRRERLRAPPRADRARRADRPRRRCRPQAMLESASEPSAPTSSMASFLVRRREAASDRRRACASRSSARWTTSTRRSSADAC